MNIAQLGMATSVAAMPLAQARSGEADRLKQDVSVHDRRVESTAQAETAEGIGTTNEEQAASDRDADGRRAWELAHTDLVEDPEESSGSPHRAKDPSGQAGAQLDLSG